MGCKGLGVLTVQDGTAGAIGQEGEGGQGKNGGEVGGQEGQQRIKGERGCARNSDSPDGMTTLVLANLMNLNRAPCKL